MKTVCKSFFSCCLLGLAALTMTVPVMAQVALEGKATGETKVAGAQPAVIISVASVENQISDISYMMKAAGFGDMAFIVKPQIKHFTNGLVADKPSGMMMYFEGDNPVPRTVGFLPVENLDDFLDTLSTLVEVDEDDDGIVITSPGGEEMFVEESGANIFIASDRAYLKNLPADPQGMLGALPTKYNMSAQIFGDRIPEELREKAISMIKGGYLEQLKELNDGEVDESQVEDFEKQISFLKDLKEAKVGMLVDKESGKLAMEFEMIAAPESRMAKAFALYSTVEPTRFGGFLKKSNALDFNTCFGIPPEDAEQYKSTLSTAIDSAITELENDGEFTDKEIGTINGALEKLSEALVETFEKGRIDTGGQVLMDGTEVNIVSGAEVADPKKVESAAKDLINLAKTKFGEQLTVNLDSGSYKGANIHELTVAVPEGEEELRDVFGPQVKILLGIGAKDVFFAAGTNPLDKLKASIDSMGTGKPEYPVIYNLRIDPILDFFANATGNPIVNDLSAKMKELGKDTMTIYSKPIENGLFTRAEMGDGPLGLIQTGIQAFQGGLQQFEDF